MEELVQQAAEVLGWPPTMVERSARARAQADGVAVEAVLAAWGGGEAPAADAPADQAAAAEVPAPAEAPGPAEAPAATTVAEAPQVEVLGGTPDAEDQPVEEPEPEPIRPKRPVSVPAWLAASFVVVPVVAVFYAVFFPNGPDCGEGAQLAIDPVTGQAVNCDGSPFGASQINFLAMGEEIYATQCAACHGADGAGGGTFPELSGGAVLATFPSGSCSEHLEWVSLGTLGWPDPTYGANATPVGASGGQMPAFGASLSEEDLASVVLFERVAFGGQQRSEGEADCGLGEAAGEEEELQAAP